LKDAPGPVKMGGQKPGFEEKAGVEEHGDFDETQPVFFLENGFLGRRAAADEDARAQTGFCEDAPGPTEVLRQKPTADTGAKTRLRRRSRVGGADVTPVASSCTIQQAEAKLDPPSGGLRRGTASPRSTSTDYFSQNPQTIIRSTPSFSTKARYLAFKQFQFLRTGECVPNATDEA
jgi:hypothetical protein